MIKKTDDSTSAFDNAWAIITEESNVAIELIIMEFLFSVEAGHIHH